MAAPSATRGIPDPQGRLRRPPSPLLGLVVLASAFYSTQLAHPPVDVIVGAIIIGHGVGVAWLPQITLGPEGIAVRRVLTRTHPLAHHCR